MPRKSNVISIDQWKAKKEGRSRRPRRQPSAQLAWQREQMRIVDEVRAELNRRLMRLA